MTFESVYHKNEAMQPATTEFDDNVSSLLQSKQQEFDRHMRTVTELSYEVEQSQATGNVDGQKVEQLQNQLNNHVYPIIASLRALQRKYEEQTDISRDSFNENDQLWTTNTKMQDTHAHIQQEQQKFDSVKALSVQTLELYRHQTNVMWTNVILLVLLAVGVAYMYYYVNSMSGDAHSLVNLPSNPKEVLDNNSIKYKDLLPDERPVDIDQLSSSSSSSSSSMD
jgi:hypothetical protein